MSNINPRVIFIKGIATGFLCAVILYSALDKIKEPSSDEFCAGCQKILTDESCLKCHGSITKSPSSQAIGKLHDAAIRKGRNGGYGCVSCHNDLHPRKAPAQKAKEYEQAENNFCYVCHLNFQGEELADTHKNANVGCVDCHGESEAHSADEDHVIPPDEMFDKSDINNLCLKCHQKSTVEEHPGHRVFFAGSDPDFKYCTDCHGMHSIPKRHRKWDRKTGKLIFRDGYSTDGGSGGM